MKYSLPFDDMAPRRDLREDAFRKYEPYILRGCTESFVISPPVGMRASTFVGKFHDAILGYRRYHYSSKLPANFEELNVRAVELMDGSIRILSVNRVARENSRGELELICKRLFDTKDEKGAVLAATKANLEVLGELRDQYSLYVMDNGDRTVSVYYFPTIIINEDGLKGGKEG